MAICRAALCESDVVRLRGTHRDNLVGDNRRQNRLLTAGFRLPRFTAADVRRSPDDVVRQVREALAAGTAHTVDPVPPGAWDCCHAPGWAGRLRPPSFPIAAHPGRQRSSKAL